MTRSRPASFAQTRSRRTRPACRRAHALTLRALLVAGSILACSDDDGDSGTGGFPQQAPPASGTQQRSPSRTPTILCSNTCRFAFDLECDDGGEGATTTACTLGTDCFDCGETEI